MDAESTIAEDSTRIPPLPDAGSPRRLLLLAGVLVATSTIGAALAPYLAIHQPLLLLALNPWPRHMLLVAPLLPLTSFMLVATVRAFVACAVGYEIGRRYGFAGLRLFEERFERLGRLLSAVERVFRRASVPLLVIAPGPLTAALAGVGGVRRAFAFPALIAGEALWVYALYRLGDVLSPWIKPVLHFMQQHLLATTAACAACVLLYQWISRRRRQQRLRPSMRPDAER